jgi:NADH:ubiquinone reductase (non-electrogenic)
VGGVSRYFFGAGRPKPSSPPEPQNGPLRWASSRSVSCGANAQAAGTGSGSVSGQTTTQPSRPVALGTEDNQAPPRICIVGGGFGGLYTAVKLEQLMWPKGAKPQVTLVDQNARFSFKPLLYDVLTESATEDEVAPTYASLLGPYSVRYIQGKVSGVIDTEEKAVLLQDGGRIPYDWLVMALGAKTNSFGIPGVQEHALQFATYDDAIRLKEELGRFGKGDFPEICVVGGGYAGVELAASLVDRLGAMCRVKLVTSGDDIMENSPEGQRDAAKEALKNDGVSVMCRTVVEKIQTAGSSNKKLIHTSDRESSSRKEIIESDIVVWTAGQSPALQGEGQSPMPFKVNGNGAMETDRTLKVVDTQCVFALGDVAIASQQSLPATAQVALQQADFVAWNIWASINKKPLLNFKYQHLGNMMSLGASNGAVSLPIPVPPPISAAIKSSPFGDILKAAGVSINTTFGGASDGVTVKGPLGALMRRAAYLYRQPTDAQKLNVLTSWGEQVQRRVKGRSN